MAEDGGSQPPAGLSFGGFKVRTVQSTSCCTCLDHLHCIATLYGYWTRVLRERACARHVSMHDADARRSACLM